MFLYFFSLLQKTEIALANYSFQACVFHLLHKRAPQFPASVLGDWWRSESDRWRVAQHFNRMCKDVMAMMQSMKILERTSQLAKVFGIDFTSVLTRGSQYRVESMLLRLTKVFQMVFAAVDMRSQTKA